MRTIRGGRDGMAASAAPGSAGRQARGVAAAATGNAVFKSGPLFISSKGIGWKTWKKRWFILTRTSLVFFKSDPSTLPQRSEVNLTLGGIDLNNSGSVVVREDKRLLTVLFPDGRDGRAFTLKAESSEDLFEWKTALEEALAQAPNAALVMGHNGIFRNDTTDVYEGAIPNWGKKRPIKSIVVGRPILLALEDIDGSPSFLEKALCFLEKHGMKVEGILRQAADVEEVDRRLQEYEQGRTEFAPEEDAHVVGDCVKHVLRELPSSPVPASCCTALLEAFRLETKESQIKSMRAAISETFPEPNRRLLQRLLKMMHTIASHTAENRMTPSAVAACMAPLLLRPLLAGECEMEDDLDMNGDSAAQLIAAANAANSAQGIVTTLLEEYKSIFNDEHFRCSLSPDSQTGDSGSEESTDDETVDTKGNGFHDAENDVDQELDDAERMLSGKFTETSASACADLYDHKEVNGNSSDTELFVEDHTFESNVDLNDAPLSRLTENGKGPSNLMSAHETPLSVGEILLSLDAGIPLPCRAAEYSSKPNGTQQHVKRTNLWGWSNVRKGQRSELVDPSGEEELAIQRLEVMKNDLQIRIAKEARGNAILQASLERRKQALHERRVALEQDVSRLQEQLQAERDLRAALEVGLSMSSSQFSSSLSMDSKTKSELEEIALAEADVARLKQKVAELHFQLNQQRQHQYGSSVDANDHPQHLLNHLSQNIVQTGFDRSVAFCNQEKQRNEQGVEYGRPPSVSSSTLVELTTRLDFFKERRSQLMEQLHSLDLGHGSTSHGFPYKPSSPWNSPK
ncbi:rho GTPase-activating protein 7 isoform X6 [Zea mays]|uniref:Rho GTPase-activating protein 7 n=1 Tax=Zea mays TaxID=4577 RepID=A0A1D6ILY9_MAIZE|nr:rho GTPase-activating protein 7 isoform X6 [Zea mays]ONM60346.1 Rho GTPase-activating protein 7 [Zea mays]|eukprot:XP_020396437.1 rho GTPase-activating protein 7 isoform X6 [Zea mays]